MFLVINIGRPPFKYHNTCDWLKTPYESLNTSM